MSAFSESTQYWQTLRFWCTQILRLRLTSRATLVMSPSVAFFSKKLNPAETRYSAFDRELLAVYATIKHFRHNLEGRNFFVNTDHKPSTFVMSSAESAFSESKQILANATLLVHPEPMAQINITCDASDVAVGGVLQQYLNGMWQPLSFFTKKLNPAKTRFSAFDRELLAVYATIKHFRQNLEGRNFLVNTDHKPLTFVMSSVTEHASLRQTQHLAFIAEFTTDIRYVKGETNFVADALSRPSVSVMDDGPVINYKELSIDQAKDAEFTRLRLSTTSTMNFKLLISFDNQLIWCDVSTKHTRPYVTAKFRRKVFSNLHGLGYPFHRATKPLINTRFVWHGMNIDIARWCRSCKGRQTAKVSRHNTPVFG